MSFKTCTWIKPDDGEWWKTGCGGFYKQTSNYCPSCGSRALMIDYPFVMVGPNEYELHPDTRWVGPIPCRHGKDKETCPEEVCELKRELAAMDARRYSLADIHEGENEMSVWMLEYRGMDSLIPSYINYVPSGAALGCKLGWTTDPSLALQFARRGDAEAFAFLHATDIGPLTIATEHGRTSRE